MTFGDCANCGKPATPTNGIAIKLSDGRILCQKCTSEYLHKQADLGDETAQELLRVTEGEA